MIVPERACEIWYLIPSLYSFLHWVRRSSLRPSRKLHWEIHSLLSILRTKAVIRIMWCSQSIILLFLLILSLNSQVTLYVRYLNPILFNFIFNSFQIWSLISEGQLDSGWVWVSLDYMSSWSSYLNSSQHHSSIFDRSSDPIISSSLSIVYSSVSIEISQE